MSPEAKNVWKCCFNHSGDSCNSEITDDEEYAKTVDPDCMLADKVDLIGHWRETGESFSGILNTYDGLLELVGFNEETGEPNYQSVQEKRLAS